jgi:hypothetical protein
MKKMMKNSFFSRNNFKEIHLNLRVSGIFRRDVWVVLCWCYLCMKTAQSFILKAIITSKLDFSVSEGYYVFQEQLFRLYLSEHHLDHCWRSAYWRRDRIFVM